MTRTGLIWVVAAMAAVTAGGDKATAAQITIVLPKGASPLEVFAAREVQRYLYVRTGQVLSTAEVTQGMLPPGDVLLLGTRASLSGVEGISGPGEGAGPGSYAIKTESQDGRRLLAVVGSDPVATLYGAYRLAEHFGVRFYLEGDVVPDEQVPLELPNVDEQAKPLFEHRGIQPFHDFPEGPDWWSTDGYKAIIAQLPKLRMNFIGLHIYPEGGVGPEPTVWIGRPEDLGPDGQVKASYPSRHFSTVSGTWGSQPCKTSEYYFGAAQLFEADAWSQDVQMGKNPWPATPEDANALFNLFGRKLRAAFEYARALGVQTCVGTETPLTVPRQVRERLNTGPSPIQALGGNVANYGSPIADTDDDLLYQSVRWDVSGYRFRVPEGRYSVILKFCEVAYDAPGKRVFGVRVQGRQVIEGLDVFAKVGKNRVLDYTFNGVEVTDGGLAIDFTKEVEFPAVAAIVVEGGSTNLKVNCGGGAYQDYRADENHPILPEDIQKLYEGMFTWIKQAYPIDYYWFWTPEGWTWEGVSEATVRATLDDLRLAMAAAEAVKAPFTLATCGWVLGPQFDRSLFDRELPKHMPMSCINRATGHDPVEAGFAKVSGRPKWAIPWVEDDPALTGLQLWVGRMRKDAADALDYGCTGLLGIHWRTRVLGPNFSALAQAAWDQRGWRGAKNLTMGAKGGRAVEFAGRVIGKTQDATLYQTMRVGMSAYGLEVVNGTYRVTLQFCEPVHGEKGKRVFSIKINGQKVAADLDIFARVGKDVALDVSFDGVTVADGWLDIAFEPRAGEPCASGIISQGPGGVQKINCGGPLYKDYAADPKPTPAYPRYLPSEDFYLDWATIQFGKEAGPKAGALFARLDNRLPRPTTWIDGPGGVVPDPRSWDEAAKEYAFVDEMAALRPLVRGDGDLDRFDFWLNQFRYLRAVARANCMWAKYNETFKEVEVQKDTDTRQKLAREKCLPARRALVEAVKEVYTLMLATVSNTGEMGTIANWQQHNMPMMLDRPGEALAKVLGEPLPANAMPGLTYIGPSRLFVPEVRTSIALGEDLSLRIIVLDQAMPNQVTVFWRPIGTAEFSTVSLSHAGRGVWTGRLPTAARGAVIVEYYVEAPGSAGKVMRWPATAPRLNQTVVVMP